MNTTSFSILHSPGAVRVSAPDAQGGAAENGLGDLPEWQLEDLYPAMDSPAFAEDMARVKSDAEAFQRAHAGQLERLAREAPEKLGAAIGEYEAIEERMGRIMSYAALVYTGETTNPKKAKFYGDAQEQITDASTPLLFFTLEFNRIGDDILQAAIKADETLAHYRPWIDDLRKDKPYQLEDRVEELFHEKAVTGRNAWNRLFDETMASLRFQIDGEPLTSEPAFNLLQHADRAKREAAAKEIGRVLADNSRIFTLITNTLAKDKEISDRWRGFSDVAHSRHLANRIEPEVVDALVSAVERSFPAISHRYYGMKARWLGVGQLQHWDRNAPLPAVAEAVYDWDSARKIVLDAYHGFSPEMAEIAGRFFDRGWIDAPVRPGKSPGAFAHPTVPSVHPYVMLNYLGKPRDVMTLAHELGHGVHQVLAADQGLLMAQTPLTLAETASVFGEMLTFRALLARAKNPAERKVMLARKIEDMINTVVRQIAFYLFERKVHTARAGGEITSEQLGEMWLEVQYESLGPVFTFDEGYRHYWSYIPHFVHSPFYVYAYAFGDCLVNSLYAVYENSEEGFQRRYFDMLKAGGTRHHSELLKPFGLDAGDPGFWDRGLSMITGLIDELETLEAAS
ncbi:M3 family oligoendopeptidase [Salaquimonas pukyongi]|uniref:M3 family oligoendopeptidase n=1 Tax=Salaquimonas pukyongi TaxID=2712698 RepID=UPI00096B7713|nr:M3 family oligoendopeptidase [Salaquimonas pukyongi]